MSKFLKVLLSSMFFILMIGCGGHKGSSDSDNGKSHKDFIIGTIIDAKVNGIRYVSKTYPKQRSEVSKDGGKFKFKRAEETKFYVGDILIGTANPVKDDNIVYLADMLGYERDVINEEILSLALFLQTIDEDQNNDYIIKIGDNWKKFVGFNGKNIKDIGLNIASITALLKSKNFIPKDIDSVKSHLLNSLKSNGIYPIKDQTVGTNNKENNNQAEDKNPIVIADTTNEHINDKKSEQKANDDSKNAILFVKSTPADKSNNIEIDSNITISFDKDIKSFDKEKFVLLKSKDGSSIVSVDIIKSNTKDIIIKPVNNLEYNTTYYVAIKPNAVIDNDDKALVGDKTISFKTKKKIEKKPAPNKDNNKDNKVIDFSSSVPKDKSIDFGIDKNIIITFTKDVVNFAKSSFILSTKENASNGIDISISKSGKDIIIDPVASLKKGVKYFLTIKAGGVSGANSALVDDKTIFFTTKPESPNPTNNTCKDGFTSYSDGCYKVVKKNGGYASAKSSCEAIGGKLMPKTQAEKLVKVDSFIEKLSSFGAYWIEKESNEPYQVGKVFNGNGSVEVKKALNETDGLIGYICRKNDGKNEPTTKPDSEKKPEPKPTQDNTTTCKGSKGFTSYDNGSKCYKVVNEKSMQTNWDSAAQKCKALGAKLLPLADGKRLMANDEKFKKSVTGGTFWIEEKNSAEGYTVLNPPFGPTSSGSKSTTYSGYVCYIGDTNKPKTKTATLHDGLIIGATYKTKTQEGITNEKGEFEYLANESVEFFAGAIKIGSVKSVPDDNRVFIQDLLDINRSNVQNKKVLKIARFLQSLDKQPSNDKVTDIAENAKKFTDSKDLDSLDIATLLSSQGINAISEKDAKDHLVKHAKDEKVIVDIVTPTLTSAVPAKSSPSANLYINSSEELNPSTVSNTTIKLFEGANEITDINVSLDGAKKKIIINPNSDLLSSTKYDIKIKGVEDKNENKADFNTSFTTADTTKPSITKSTPTNKDTNVSLQPSIVLNVSETVNVVDGKIKLYKEGDTNDIDINVAGDNTNELTITVSADLDSETLYELVVPTDALKDLENNTLDSEFKLEFKTKDVAKPTFSEDTSDVSKNPKSVVFKIKASEDLKESTLTTNNIILYKKSDTAKTPIEIDITYADADKIIKVVPENELESLVEYVVELKNVEDLSGLKGDNTEFSFTTEDAEAPQVDSTSLGTKTIDVSVSDPIILHVNKKLNSNDAPVELFEIAQDETETLVSSFTSDYSDQNITITLTQELKSQTKYKIVVPKGMLINQDGIGSENDYILEFTTKDAKAPEFVSAEPTKSVETNGTITLSFSEDLNLVNASSVEVETVSGAIKETVLDSNESKIKVTFKDGVLLHETNYKLIIPKTAITDEAGNEPKDNVEVDFRTKKAPPKCPADFKEYPADSLECYKAVETEVKWAEAKAECEKLDAILAPKAKIESMLTKINEDKSILDVTENDYLLEQKDNYSAHSLRWSKYNYPNPSFVMSSVNKTGSKNRYICYAKKVTPTITATKPSDTQKITSTKQTIKITFSEAMKNEDTNNVKLSLNGTDIDITVSLDASKKILSIKPSIEYTASLSYVVTLNPDTANTKIVDVFNNELKKSEKTFNTADALSTCEGASIDGSCYVWVKDEKNWSDADAHCTSLGGSLVSKDNTKLNDIGLGLNLKVQDDSYNDMRYWLKDADSYGGAHLILKKESGVWKNPSMSGYSYDSNKLQFVCKTN